MSLRIPCALLARYLAGFHLNAQDNAAALLKKVAAHYKTLSTYTIKAETTYLVTQGGQSGAGQKKTVLAIGKEGRFRVEQEDGNGVFEIRASDGTTVGKELPRQKAWSKEEALRTEASTDDDDASESTARMDLLANTEQTFVKRYTGLSQYASIARIEKEERLKFNGAKVDCILVHIPFKSGDRTGARK